MPLDIDRLVHPNETPFARWKRHSGLSLQEISHLSKMADPQGVGLSVRTISNALKTATSLRAAFLLTEIAKRVPCRAGLMITDFDFWGVTHGAWELPEWAYSRARSAPRSEERGLE